MVEDPGSWIMGIDLAGSALRSTGVCVLKFNNVKTFLCFSDEEIIDLVNIYQPVIIAMDAPLSLPSGRQNIDDRQGPHFRECDLALRRRKIPFLPITLGPMRDLTKRGMNLKAKLERKGFHVIEVYPGGAQDILGLPRAKKDPTSLYQGLVKLGLKGLSSRCSSHELDAVTAAIVARYFLQGKAEIYGDLEKGAIIMPLSPR